MQDCQSKSSVNSSLEWALSGYMQGYPPEDSTATMQDGTCEEETIEFGMENDSFRIPPSFSQTLNEETLWMYEWPFVFKVMLKLAIPENLVNPADAVSDALANFINQAMEEDKHFVVYPYVLCEYTAIKDLPPVVDNVGNLPKEPNEWLPYFLQAKPRGCGGDIYTAVLFGMSVPFPKFIKQISTWCKEKKLAYGNWPCNLKNLFCIYRSANILE